MVNYISILTSILAFHILKTEGPTTLHVDTFRGLDRGIITLIFLVFQTVGIAGFSEKRHTLNMVKNIVPQRLCQGLGHFESEKTASGAHTANNPSTEICEVSPGHESSVRFKAYVRSTHYLRLISDSLPLSHHAYRRCKHRRLLHVSWIVPAWSRS